MPITPPPPLTGTPPAWLAPRGGIRERLTAKFLARALPSMTPPERFAFEERVAICIFDGGLTEAEAIRIALNDYAVQRVRSE